MGPYNNRNQNRRNSGAYYGYKEDNLPKARTPYNFVKLNKDILNTPLGTYIVQQDDEAILTEEYMDFVKSEGKYSGYFNIELTNKTPLYIGSKNGFFSAAGEVVVPGSSVRGCLKNIFKIITCSAFRADKDNADVEDSKLYFRDMASPFKALKKLYLSKMISDDARKTLKTKAGLLVKDKKDRYYIIPSEYEAQKGKYFNGVKYVNGYTGYNKVAVYVGINPTPRLQKNERKGSACIIWHADYVDVFTGEMQNKKAFYRIKNPKWNNKLEVDAELVETYRIDAERRLSNKDEKGNENKKQVLYNLLNTDMAVSGEKPIVQKLDSNPYQKIIKIPYEIVKKGKTVRFIKLNNEEEKVNEDLPEIKNEEQRLKNLKDNVLVPGARINFLENAKEYVRIVPCFYTVENGRVKAFGTNPYFRIPYNKGIADHVPENLKINKIDFTDAVFGNKDKWGGRVFFEDLYLKDGVRAVFERPDKHKILMGPQPTSFQFYLEPKDNEAATWDDGTNIRGYKLYWHKKCDWQDRGNAKNSSLQKEIQPLKPGHTFIGRIRFENLCKIELGALCALFTLGAEKNICYKMGMGKPLGMGTVKITGNLFLQGPDYYTHLFTKQSTFDECAEPADITGFANVFYEYVKAELENSNVKNEYKYYLERLQELRYIMSVDKITNDKWSEETKYLDIYSEEGKKVFGKRAILPEIKEVWSGMEL